MASWVLPSILIAILIAASWIDFNTHRIPNALSLGGAILGLLFHTITDGFTGAQFAGSGLIVGLALLLPFYLLGGMGAGDVKLMGCVGAFLGAKLVFVAILATFLAGLPMAIALLIAKFGFKLPILSRYWLMLKVFVRTFQFVYIPPSENDPVRQQFPYAGAILAGTLIALWWTNSSGTQV